MKKTVLPVNRVVDGMYEVFMANGFESALDFFVQQVNKVGKILLCRCIMLIPTSHSFSILYEQSYDKHFHIFASNRPYLFSAELEEFMYSLQYPASMCIPLDFLPYFTEKSTKEEVFAIRLALYANPGSVISLTLITSSVKCLIPENMHVFQDIVGAFGSRLSTVMDMEAAFTGKLEKKNAMDFVETNFSLHPIIRQIRQIAHTDISVIIYGESGVGKEFIARALHETSLYAKGPFVEVNCGALPENLADSLLFGHEKGAFTGAINTMPGYFEQSQGGTLFLDEVGELSTLVQTKLLKVLENKKIQRLGSQKTIQLNMRVVAATNKNLQQMVKNGQFREDLLFRLNRFILHIPPLRERKQDIYNLLSYFMKKKTQEYRLAEAPHIAPSSIDKIYQYNWPGNLREFENMLDRAFIRNIGSPNALLQLDFPEDAVFMQENKLAQENSAAHLPYREKTLDEVIAEHVAATLHRCRGKIYGEDGAAKKLGIHPNTLCNYKKKYGLK